MDTYILLALFSGIAVAACLFVAGYFFFVNNDRLIQRVLGFMFLAIALRVGKSIFYYLFPDMSLVGISIGFLGLTTIGPLLWIYMGLSTGMRAQLKKHDLFHLAFPIIGFAMIITGAQLLTPSMAYAAGTAILFIYLMNSWRLVTDKQTQHQDWNIWLLGSITLIWGALAYQLISETILNYAYGAAVAALISYVLIFRMLKNPAIFQKRSGITIQPDLIQRVVKSLEDEQFYQSPSLNLSRFAQRLNEPVYLVSKAVKRHYGKNFPEVVNSLRIREVTRRLKDEKNRFYKVEGMAYDVGFNTPSAFYAAFKKETSSSPREYQRMLH